MKDVVSLITDIRAKNNKNWMDLLRLALKARPRQARAIMKQITKNDREISKLCRKL